MTLSQVLWLPVACLAGLAVSRTGSLAGYCDRWLQAALPTLVLPAVAAELEQIGVNVIFSGPGPTGSKGAGSVKVHGTFRRKRLYSRH